ncbi:MAG: tetratricopeptide repeat protein [Verrucomicrobiota bacterium]
MSKIEPPNLFHLRAAIGWMELGNIPEALAELDGIGAGLQLHPDVLEVRWMVIAHSADWDAALVVAEKLLAAAPERSSSWLNRAYALRRVTRGSLQQAWEALLPAHEKFPKDATVAFNLSCYACQLNRLDEARSWYQRALQLGGKDTVKAMALADSDLEPLWEEIRGL